MTHTGCSAPPFRALIDTYCWGDASDAERMSFEAHLLECDACWEEVQRLERAIGALRSDAALAHPGLMADLLRVTGLSGKLGDPFAGHRNFALRMSALFGIAVSLAVPAELAYGINDLAGVVLLWTPIAAVTMAGAVIGSLAIASARTRAGRSGTVWIGASLVAAAIAALMFAMRNELPSAPVVQATFQTFTPFAGMLKNFAHGIALATLAILVPFACVTALQRELSTGRPHVVVRTLSEKFPPPLKSAIYISPRLLGALAIAFNLLLWIGSVRVFDALQPGDFMNLFLTVAIARLTLFIVISVAGITWYSRLLGELMREAQAGLAVKKSIVVH